MLNHIYKIKKIRYLQFAKFSVESLLLFLSFLSEKVHFLLGGIVTYDVTSSMYTAKESIAFIENQYCTKI